MDQRRPLHASSKGNNVLRSDNVRAQGTFECGIESDIAGAVNNHIEVVRYALGFFLAIAEVRIADIAPEHDYFVANKPLEGAPISFAQGIEWRGREHTVPETRFRLFTGAST